MSTPIVRPGSVRKQLLTFWVQKKTVLGEEYSPGTVPFQAGKMSNVAVKLYTIVRNVKPNTTL
jgi:hypothetical protein